MATENYTDDCVFKWFKINFWSSKFQTFNIISTKFQTKANYKHGGISLSYLDTASISATSSEEENFPFTDSGDLLRSAVAYTDDEEILKINHPLYIMVGIVLLLPFLIMNQYLVFSIALFLYQS